LIGDAQAPKPQNLGIEGKEKMKKKAKIEILRFTQYSHQMTGFDMSKQDQKEKNA
jgi:hypothetical protein